MNAPHIKLTEVNGDAVRMARLRCSLLAKLRQPYGDCCKSLQSPTGGEDTKALPTRPYAHLS